ncbi:hypothetical protein FHU10_1262 [Serratia fonticola]|uniref:Uncharacterized protein n=1 Tax=Serratia fonticola TaxID=47917 RepID=A0A542D868_SERFO|nr:hypothetical protein FHU09_1189 [Serratia fonticola]TQI99281.1 hypothetical protein FHU11_4863 [Serratia fonticola]TVZ68806.1 hypothetical protein FHU10_1262 [Serratia fonticola]
MQNQDSLARIADLLAVKLGGKYATARIKDLKKPSG